MPPGIPVATVGIGEARNAGLLAVRIVAATDPELRRRMQTFQADLAAAVRDKDAGVRKQFE
jgi:5-(carboxyamino)imidazole ribonucleotide mutase